MPGAQGGGAVGIGGGGGGEAGEGGGDGGVIEAQGVRAVREAVTPGGGGEAVAGCGVLEQAGEARARVVGVERQVGGAGLEGGEQGDDQFGRAVQAEGDDVLGPDAVGDEVPGEPVGAGVEFGVAEGLVRADQGGVPWGTGDLLLEQCDQGVRGARGGGVVEVVHEVLALCGAEDGEPVQRGGGVVGDLFQQPHQARGVTGQLLHRVAFGIAAQFELQRKPGATVVQDDRQIVAPQRVREVMYRKALAGPGDGVIVGLYADDRTKTVGRVRCEAEVMAQVLVAVALSMQQLLESRTRRAEQIERRVRRLDLEMYRQDGAGYAGDAELGVEPACHPLGKRDCLRPAQPVKIACHGNGEDGGETGSLRRGECQQLRGERLPQFKRITDRRGRGLAQGLAGEVHRLGQ